MCQNMDESRSAKGLTQGTLHYRYVSEPPALLRVEASVSILLLFSVFLFPERYERNHFSRFMALKIYISSIEFKFRQDPLSVYPLFDIPFSSYSIFVLY